MNHRYKDIIAWLGWVFASPIAVLCMVLFLLGACTPLDLCPDMQCEYGYAEAAGDDGKDRGDDNNGQDKGSEKGEADTGKGHGGKDKGKDGEDD